MQVAPESLYTFNALRDLPSRQDELFASFQVEASNGQTHEELLSLTVIETRIMLWDDALAHNPSLAWRDEVRSSNYWQYVQALIAALKRQL